MYRTWVGSREACFGAKVRGQLGDKRRMFVSSLISQGNSK